jgi:hypothetical protein
MAGTEHEQAASKSMIRAFIFMSVAFAVGV